MQTLVSILDAIAAKAASVENLWSHAAPPAHAAPYVPTIPVSTMPSSALPMHARSVHATPMPTMGMVDGAHLPPAALPRPPWHVRPSSAPLQVQVLLRDSAQQRRIRDVLAQELTGYTICSSARRTKINSLVGFAMGPFGDLLLRALQKPRHPKDIVSAINRAIVRQGRPPLVLKARTLQDGLYAIMQLVAPGQRDPVIRNRALRTTLNALRLSLTEAPLSVRPDDPQEYNRIRSTWTRLARLWAAPAGAPLRQALRSGQRLSDAYRAVANAMPGTRADARLPQPGTLKTCIHTCLRDLAGGSYTKAERPALHQQLRERLDAAVGHADSAEGHSPRSPHAPHHHMAARSSALGAAHAPAHAHAAAATSATPATGSSGTGTEMAAPSLAPLPLSSSNWGQQREALRVLASEQFKDFAILSANAQHQIVTLLRYAGGAWGPALLAALYSNDPPSQLVERLFSDDGTLPGAQPPPSAPALLDALCATLCVIDGERASPELRGTDGRRRDRNAVLHARLQAVVQRLPCQSVVATSTSDIPMKQRERSAWSHLRRIWASPARWPVSRALRDNTLTLNAAANSCDALQPLRQDHGELKPRTLLTSLTRCLGGIQVDLSHAMRHTEYLLAKRQRLVELMDAAVPLTAELASAMESAPSTPSTPSSPSMPSPASSPDAYTPQAGVPPPFHPQQAKAMAGWSPVSATAHAPAEDTSDAAAPSMWDDLDAWAPASACTPPPLPVDEADALFNDLLGPEGAVTDSGMVEPPFEVPDGVSSWTLTRL